MKKYFFSIIVSIALLTIPAVVFGAGADSFKDSYCGANITQGIGDQFGVHFCSASQTLIWAIDFLLSIIALVSVLFIVIGGYRYVTSGGNSEQAEKGRAALTNAVIGLLIAVLAYSIVSVISTSIKSANNNAPIPGLVNQKSGTIPGQGGGGTGGGTGGGGGSSTTITFSPTNRPSLQVNQNMTIQVNDDFGSYVITGNSNSSVVDANLSSDETGVVLTGKAIGSSTIKVCEDGGPKCGTIIAIVTKETGQSSCDGSTNPVDIFLLHQGGVMQVGDEVTQEISVQNHQNVAIKNPLITWDVRDGDSSTLVYENGSLTITASSPSNLKSSNSDQIFTNLTGSGLSLNQIDPCGSIDIQFKLKAQKTGTVVNETHVSGDNIKKIGDSDTMAVQ